MVILRQQIRYLGVATTCPVMVVVEKNICMDVVIGGFPEECSRGIFPSHWEFTGSIVNKVVDVNVTAVNRSLTSPYPRRTIRMDPVGAITTLRRAKSYMIESQAFYSMSSRKAMLYDRCKVNTFTWRVNQPTLEYTDCERARGNATGARN